MKTKLTEAQLRTLRHLCGLNWRNTGPAFAQCQKWRGALYWVLDNDTPCTRTIKALIDAGLAYCHDGGRYAYVTQSGRELVAELDKEK